jgi:N-acyl amino acid synthase of PEP-CTERM/exosortase system
MPNSVIDAFNEYFEIVPAYSDDLKNEVYKLRYQVYCIETGFENPAQYDDNLEVDDYDDSSIHCLIQHRRSKIYAATTRLILPNVNNPEKKFPIELHSQIDNFDVLNHIPRTNLAEVSRFCVSKEFKRRKKEYGMLSGIGQDSDNTFTDDERRIFPHITIALITCLIKMSNENNIYYWYAVMEPALLRFLSGLGIYFIHIGPLSDYHGKRQPCVVKVIDLLEGVFKKSPDIWEMLTNEGLYSNNIQDALIHEACS